MYQYHSRIFGPIIWVSYGSKIGLPRLHVHDFPVPLGYILMRVNLKMLACCKHVGKIASRKITLVGVYVNFYVFTSMKQCSKLNTRELCGWHQLYMRINSWYFCWIHPYFTSAFRQLSPKLEVVIHFIECHRYIDRDGHVSGPFENAFRQLTKVNGHEPVPSPTIIRQAPHFLRIAYSHLCVSKLIFAILSIRRWILCGCCSYVSLKSNMFNDLSPNVEAIDWITQQKQWCACFCSHPICSSFMVASVLLCQSNIIHMESHEPYPTIIVLFH